MGGMTKDRRYQKTEGKILSVFFDMKYNTMLQIAKKAGVARSTIYTHHHSVMKILPDWEEYILEEYYLYIEKKSYFEMLIFILRYQKFFEVFLKFGDREIIMKMIFITWGIRKPKKVSRILASEISEIIFEWGEDGFSRSEIEKVLFDIRYLVKTAEERLEALNS